MPETLELLDRGSGPDGARLYVLRIETAQPLPLLVGMSFKTMGKVEHEEVVWDIPARRLRRTGIVVWRASIPDHDAPPPRFANRTGPAPDISHRFKPSVRFSTWTPGFGTRLADTGWIEDRYMRLLVRPEYDAIVSSTREEDCWEPWATSR